MLAFPTISPPQRQFVSNARRHLLRTRVLFGLLESRLELRGAFWRLVAGLNNSFSYLGFAVAAVFALCWLGSLLGYHWSGDNRRGVAATVTE